jgi:hypothetical protein
MTNGSMNSVAAARRTAAPNPEWVLMYRGGVTRRRIAELAGVPASTLNHHLRLACAADPELLPAHEMAARSRPSRVTAQGLERMHELVALVQETCRYPSRNATSTSERTLAVWLQRRRGDARPGRLPPARRLAAHPAVQAAPR